MLVDNDALKYKVKNFSKNHWKYAITIYEYTFGTTK